MEYSKITIQQVDTVVKLDSDIKKMNIDSFLTIYYAQSLIEKGSLIEDIKMPYFNREMNFNLYLSSISDEITLEEINDNISNGKLVALYKGTLRAVNVCTKKNYRDIEANIKEASLQGTLEEFSEDLDLNISLLRRYYTASNLVVKEFEVGDLIKNKGVILYNEEKVNTNSLNLIEQSIREVKSPVVQTVRELEQHMIKRQWLFPRIFVNYRPDRVARSLAKGKVSILLNNTSAAGILPVSFHEYFVAVDDYYLYPMPALLFSGIRYLAFFLSMILPAAYVAITSFNPEIFRIQLALSITESRSGVTYPSYIEVLFMLIVLEFLVEASIRLPKTIGQAATTVGGLILGQAAADAQLVSNIMIIIAATTAIANFCMPTTCLSIPARVGKYIMLLLASVAGIYGMFIGVASFTAYAFSIHNFDVPYVNPLEALTIKNLKQFFRRNEL